jgi:tRNA 2-thiouridine synthesizing protein A
MPSALTIDARGHRCPVPTLKLRRALEQAAAGSVIELVADDPMARIDVPHFAGQVGATVLSVSEEGPALRFAVRKGP